MAYDQHLESRIKQYFEEQHLPVKTMKMMGGLCFMLNDKMCVGIIKDRLMVRVDPEHYDQLLLLPGVWSMDFTGKEMKGFIFVDADALDKDVELAHWVNLAIDFNPKANAKYRKKS